MKILRLSSLKIPALGLAILLISFFIFAVEKTMAPEKPTLQKRPPLLVRGSIPYWDQDNAVASFKKNESSFNQISLFWYWLDSDLSIKKYQYAKEDKSIIDFAHAHNVKVSFVLTNLPEEEGTNWDSARVEAVLINKETRAKHIEEIAQKVRALGADGISIDYEEVNQKEKDLFSLFIKELSARLHKDSKFVGVALHPRTGDSVPDESIGFFQDWRALGQNADQLYIMSYDEHWDTGAAGPIASVGWVSRIINYTVKLKLPKEKLFLGIPLYGYSWSKNDAQAATGLTFSEVSNLVARTNSKTQWSDDYKSPYFSYTKNGKTYEIWFENAQSIKEKVDLAYKAGFAGATFWHLGGEDPQIWAALKPYK